MILTTKSSKQRTRVLPKKQEVVIASVRVEIELVYSYRSDIDGLLCMTTHNLPQHQRRRNVYVRIAVLHVVQNSACLGTLLCIHTAYYTHACSLMITNINYNIRCLWFLTCIDQYM